MKPSTAGKGTETTKLGGVGGAGPRASLVGNNPLDQAMEAFKEGVFTSTEDYIESLSRKIVFQQQHAAAHQSKARTTGSGVTKARATVSLTGSGNVSSSSASWFDKAAGPVLEQQDESIFDSTPYEEVFESTLAQLVMLRQHVENKLAVLGKDCTVLEREYKTKLESIQRKFDKLFKEFKSFDTTINKVSTSAQRIGGALESVEAQRNRAIEINIFLDYLIKLNDDQAKPSKIFSDTTDVDNAILLKNLLVLSAELDMANTMYAKQNVEKTAEQLEQTQRDKFSRAAQEKKYATMKECANTLFELNGGEECIKAYIGQLPMFYEDDLEDAEDQAKRPSGISPGQNPDVRSPGSDAESTLSSSPQNAFSAVAAKAAAATKAQEAQKASTQHYSAPINPDYPNARKRIRKGRGDDPDDDDDTEPNFIRIDRFYEKVVQSIRDESPVITKVFPVPPLVLMRLTHRVFELRIASFVDGLLEKCSGTTIQALEIRLKTLSYAFQKMQQVIKDLSATPTSIPVAALQTFADAVFVKHREEFIKYQVQNMQLALVKEQEVEDMSPTAVQARANGKKTPFLPIDLSVDMTIRCLECAEVAADRVALLSHPKMLAENMYKIFQTLIREFGRNIMLVAVDQNIKKLSNAEPGATAANLNPAMLVYNFFQLVQTINTNVVLLQKHYFVKIRPFIEGSRNEQTLCQSEKNRLLQLLEDSIEVGLDKALKALLGEFENMLSTQQRRRHFKPKPGETEMIDFQHASDACLACCAFIKSQYSLLSDALDGRNLQAFLIEFATRILAALLRHFKKFEIDQGIGAFCLMRDMSEYQECIASFKIDRLNTDFDILKSIAKLHLVNPEQLSDVISDSALAKWTKPELESFIKMRSDYDRAWLGKYF